MASLTNIREGLAKAMDENVAPVFGDDVNVYQNIPDVLQFPALIIRPDSCDFAGTFGRDDDVWKFDLFIIVGRADVENAAEMLDELTSGSGPSSVRTAIEDNHTLGLDDTEAFVRAVKAYGGSFETAKTRHIGAVMKLEIHTDGSKV